MIADQQIEEMEQRVRERRDRECRYSYENMPALIDWMTEEEKELLHKWRMQQPTYKEMCYEAKIKVRERLMNRRKQRRGQ